MSSAKILTSKSSRGWYEYSEHVSFLPRMDWVERRHMPGAGVGIGVAYLIAMALPLGLGNHRVWIPIMMYEHRAATWGIRGS